MLQLWKMFLSLRVSCHTHTHINCYSMFDRSFSFQMIITFFSPFLRLFSLLSILFIELSVFAVKSSWLLFFIQKKKNSCLNWFKVHAQIILCVPVCPQINCYERKYSHFVVAASIQEQTPSLWFTIRFCFLLPSPLLTPCSMNYRFSVKFNTLPTNFHTVFYFIRH